MFYVNGDFVLDADNLSKIINEFVSAYLPRLEKYRRYYDGKQDILMKSFEDKTKPCNKIVKNYCKSIADNYTGYLVGNPISYKSDADMAAVQDVLNYNDITSTDKEYLRNALIYGVAYEIHYIDKYKNQRFVIPDSRECIPIYTNDLDEELLYLIRFYPVDKTNILKGYFVDVYGKDDTAHYRCVNTLTAFDCLGYTPNVFSQIPATVFKLDRDYTNIFDCILSLQDAYNKLLSSEIDDFEAFCDAYLALYGVTVDEQELAEMKTNRILVLGAESKAEYLNKNISDTQIENILDNLHKSIENIANSPDWNSENFVTNSGIATRYKILGMENRAAEIETEMRKALQRRIEIISEFISLVDSEKVWRDVDIIFIRNLPVNIVEISQVVTQLRGLVSDETLLAQIPFIVDAKEEYTKAQAENASRYKVIGGKADIDNRTLSNLHQTLSTKGNAQPLLNA